MSTKRVISINTSSKIYHKHGCRYVKKMLPQNRLDISKKEIRRQGFHCCRYCNSMNHHYNTEQTIMNHYAKNKNMEFQYVDGILYVKTEISLWKLVYSRKEEKIAIYHRNTSPEPVNLNCLEKEQFHRQRDMEYAETIQGCLNYIYEHDQYRSALERGEKNIHYSSKKYERQAVKNEKRRNINRVYYLFSVLEKQNEGYKKLSLC